MDGSWLGRALSCLAAVFMVLVLGAAAAPVWQAGATPAQAQAANPVRVRVEPTVNALGGQPMAPGDTLYRPVAVHNDGERPFTYRLAVVALEDARLGRFLQVEARATGPCDADAFAAAPSIAGPAAVAELDASAPRPVAAGGVERLCLRVHLPAGIPADVHGASLDAALQVVARQS